jgi:isoleucyl-tRNA synthetase
MISSLTGGRLISLKGCLINWREIDIVKRMFNILWNVYVFSTTYMAMDGFNPKDAKEVKIAYKTEDLWILSRLNHLVKEVTDSFESLHIYVATRALHVFILEDLSRWYIPLVRQRTWIEKDDPEKIAAYQTLWTVLKELSIIMAPITPHLSDEIYLNLVAPFYEVESVHLEDWITPQTELFNELLETRMSFLRRFSEAVASAREKKGIKRRWPVRRILFKPKDETAESALKELQNLALTQANAKQIDLIDQISEDLRNDDGKFISLEFEDGEIFIDIERTDEILKEGLARELVRRIQQMRKDMDLMVEDFIMVNIEISDEKIGDLIASKNDYISNETRAKGLYINGQHNPVKKSWVIEGKTFMISLGKVD